MNSVGKVVLAVVFRLTAAENGSTAEGSEYNIDSTAETKTQDSIQKSLSLHLILPLPKLHGGWPYGGVHLAADSSRNKRTCLQAHMLGMKRKGTASFQQVKRKMTDELQCSVWKEKFISPQADREGNRGRITTWVWVWTWIPYYVVKQSCL